MTNKLESFFDNVLYWLTEVMYWGSMAAVLILSICILASCQKEEDIECKTCDVNVEFLPSTNGDASCKTCDINVRFWSASLGSHSYIESSKVYCNGEWAYIDGVVDVTSGENSGVAWHKTSTTTCHD